MTQALVFVAVPAKRESVMQVWTETRGLASATEAGMRGTPVLGGAGEALL